MDSVIAPRQEPQAFGGVIEEGQVELLVSDAPNAPDRIVAVLSKGDFFGNAALIEIAKGL